MEKLWHDMRYVFFPANLDELRRQDAEEREMFKQSIEETKERCDERQLRTDEERQKFVEFKKEIAQSALNSRSGKPIPAKVYLWRFDLYYTSILLKLYIKVHKI